MRLGSTLRICIPRNRSRGSSRRSAPSGRGAAAGSGAIVARLRRPRHRVARPGRTAARDGVEAVAARTACRAARQPSTSRWSRRCSRATRWTTSSATARWSASPRSSPFSRRGRPSRRRRAARPERWRRVALASAKQCGTARLPAIGDVVTLRPVARIARLFAHRYLLVEPRRAVGAPSRPCASSRGRCRRTRCCWSAPKAAGPKLSATRDRRRRVAAVARPHDPARQHRRLAAAAALLARLGRVDVRRVPTSPSNSRSARPAARARDRKRILAQNTSPSSHTRVALQGPDTRQVQDHRAARQRRLRHRLPRGGHLDRQEGRDQGAAPAEPGLRRAAARAAAPRQRQPSQHRRRSPRRRSRTTSSSSSWSTCRARRSRTSSPRRARSTSPRARLHLPDLQRRRACAPAGRHPSRPAAGQRARHRERHAEGRRLRHVALPRDRRARHDGHRQPAVHGARAVPRQGGVRLRPLLARRDDVSDADRDRCPTTRRRRPISTR